MKQIVEIASLHGQGTFRRSSGETGDVSFDIRVGQEMLDANAFGRREQLEGLYVDTGNFEAASADFTVEENETLVLQTADEVDLEIRIISTFFGEQGSFQLTESGLQTFLSHYRQ